MVLSGRDADAGWSRGCRPTAGDDLVGRPIGARPAGRLCHAPGSPALEPPSSDLSDERPARSKPDVYKGHAARRGGLYGELPCELQTLRRVAVRQGAILPSQSAAHGMFSLSLLLLSVLSPSSFWPTLTSRLVSTEPSSSACRRVGRGTPIRPRPGEARSGGPRLGGGRHGRQHRGGRRPSRRRGRRLRAWSQLRRLAG